MDNISRMRQYSEADALAAAVERLQDKVRIGRDILAMDVPMDTQGLLERIQHIENMVRNIAIAQLNDAFPAAVSDPATIAFNVT